MKREAAASRQTEEGEEKRKRGSLIFRVLARAPARFCVNFYSISRDHLVVISFRATSVLLFASLPFLRPFLFLFVEQHERTTLFLYIFFKPPPRYAASPSSLNVGFFTRFPPYRNYPVVYYIPLTRYSSLDVAKGIQPMNAE